MTKNQSTTQSTKKTLRGTVVSTAMHKTVVVKIDRFIKHPKYHKFYTKSKKYAAHTEGTHAVGDMVTIQSCRPMSKTKNFMVVADTK